MDERTIPFTPTPQPERPQPRKDVDDLIFREECWLASDRKRPSPDGDGLFVFIFFPNAPLCYVFLYNSQPFRYNSKAKIGSFPSGSFEKKE